MSQSQIQSYTGLLSPYANHKTLENALLQFRTAGIRFLNLTFVYFVCVLIVVFRILASFLLLSGTTSVKTVKKKVIQHQSEMLLCTKYKSPAILNELGESLEQNQTDTTEEKSRSPSSTLSRENTFVVCKTVTKTLEKADENGVSLTTMNTSCRTASATFMSERHGSKSNMIVSGIFSNCPKITSTRQDSRLRNKICLSKSVKKVKQVRFSANSPSKAFGHRKTEPQFHLDMAEEILQGFVRLKLKSIKV